MAKKIRDNSYFGQVAKRENLVLPDFRLKKGMTRAQVAQNKNDIEYIAGQFYDLNPNFQSRISGMSKTMTTKSKKKKAIVSAPKTDRDAWIQYVKSRVKYQNIYNPGKYTVREVTLQAAKGVAYSEEFRKQNWMSGWMKGMGAPEYIRGAGGKFAGSTSVGADWKKFTAQTGWLGDTRDYDNLVYDYASSGFIYTDRNGNKWLLMIDDSPKTSVWYGI